MIVVDASVLANALVYADERGLRARSMLSADPEWAAPEHWKIELFSVMRGLALGGTISDDQAHAAIHRIPHLGVDPVPVEALLPRMWQLRAGISGYDAAYVALAESRAITLVTSDARLARTATRYCTIRLVA
ncbi:type II toxin-antitoxin system VapC family toxin [Frankia sp. CiP3]|uniref:type II toxin-antitoxin system VapC family toxin n=1 Tax=Frankia sp. CiP3 TaxID=2880971 RepID=UPI001EF580EC|nr:type II toxin-antitoxin system VapC family toxin [Frankia sp. CiP3]